MLCYNFSLSRAKNRVKLFFGLIILPARYIYLQDMMFIFFLNTAYINELKFDCQNIKFNTQKTIVVIVFVVQFSEQTLRNFPRASIFKADCTELIIIIPQSSQFCFCPQLTWLLFVYLVVAF